MRDQLHHRYSEAGGPVWLLEASLAAVGFIIRIKTDHSHIPNPSDPVVTYVLQWQTIKKCGAT